MKFFKTILFILILATASSAFAQTGPRVVTKDATNRDVTEVRLQGNATFGSGVQFGQVFFEYGRTDLYGSTTSQRQKTTPGDFNEKITGLNEDTGYHFRAALIGTDGAMYYGSDKTFITKRYSDPRTSFDDGENSTGNNSVTTDGAGEVVVECPDGTTSYDCDGDTVPDTVECPGIENGALCPDTDGDGFADRSDLDSDNDGVLDVNESPENRTDRFNSTSEEGSGNGTTGTGVDVGTIEGGGSLIPNGTGVPTVDRDLNTDFPDRGNLVPCGNGKDVTNADGTTTSAPGCGYNDAVQLIQNLINWIVSISIVIAVGIITYGGVLYLTAGSKPDNIKKAKGLFMNAAIGLFFVMFGWLIINTALGFLVNDDVVKKEEFLEQ